ncbi:hypothetical protein J4E83_005037 [Alternaria metachromatica]|uniref:uncharacterized protein n=1 Tax=Alternaria metachromatica TaxID=283354 RepID=UPI0020C2A1D9|nr:uncharacterized protein J4E83_005037 [Alternaria metachromatica]KAI4622295.1 hypothetical protein J4E83_005037 [Alternaria metachromatica]
MKRKMEEDLDVLLDETLTLCKTPPVPRRNPHRVFYQYKCKTSPPTTPPKEPENPEMEMKGPPMFHFGGQTELVPKPLFARSNSLPSQSVRPSLPSRPSEPFQFNADDIVKSPTPLFGRRNTLPSKVRRAVAAERKPSPLSRGEGVRSSQSAHTTTKKPTSPALPRKEPNTTPNPKAKTTKSQFATPQRTPRVVDIKRPSPLSGKGSARRPGPTRFAPVEPPSPIVLSPVISNSSATSSPSPSVFSEAASFSASSPSTPATSPPGSPMVPTTHARSQSLSYFPPSHWTIKPSPSPIYVPRQKLRRKDSPKMETLRTLRAKESDMMLQQIYDQHWEAYRAKLLNMTSGLRAAERL